MIKDLELYGPRHARANGAQPHPMLNDVPRALKFGVWHWQSDRARWSLRCSDGSDQLRWWVAHGTGFLTEDEKETILNLVRVLWEGAS
jgi:hypothetical protein